MFSRHHIDHQWYFHIQKEADIQVNHTLAADIGSNHIYPEYVRVVEVQYPYQPILYHLVAGSTSPPRVNDAQPHYFFQEDLYHPLEPFENAQLYAYSQYSDMAMASASIHPIAYHIPSTMESMNRVLFGSTSEAYSESLTMARTELPIASQDYPAEYTASTASITPTASSSGVRRSQNHHCPCGKSFDRASGARDCAHKHLDQTPHSCGSRCEKNTCNKAYSSGKLLAEHLDKHRLMNCPQCGKRICKKNLARHKQVCC